MRMSVLVVFAAVFFCAGGLARPILSDLVPQDPPAVSPRATQFTAVPDRQFDLVMLGDSLTDDGRWTELLPYDVANRGIGRDTVRMILLRAGDVPSGAPVYVMAGINDLKRETPIDEIVAHYRLLIEELGPDRVVVQSVLGPTGMGVAELNAELVRISRETGADFLDLRGAMGHPLQETYDGVHLTGEGYAKWSQAVRQHFAQSGVGHGRVDVQAAVIEGR